MTIYYDEFSDFIPHAFSEYNEMKKIDDITEGFTLTVNNGKKVKIFGVRFEASRKEIFGFTSMKTSVENESRKVISFYFMTNICSNKQLLKPMFPNLLAFDITFDIKDVVKADQIRSMKLFFRENKDDPVFTINLSDPKLISIESEEGEEIGETIKKIRVKYDCKFDSDIFEVINGKLVMKSINILTKIKF
jgi:hypothetical protein